MPVKRRRPMTDAGRHTAIVEAQRRVQAAATAASSVNDGIIGCFVCGVKLIQYREHRISDVTSSSSSSWV